MRDNTIEEYIYEGEGYCPLVLTDSWQVAQLNYCREQRPEALSMLDQHTFTDETFTLLQGRALLITYNRDTDTGHMTEMRPGYTYNVPMDMWHNIAMEEGSSVLITESRDAHLKGCRHIEIPEKLKAGIVRVAKESWGEVGRK